jgi:murein DD-endopeptidase MepM/ murein hydrolase activator NlpD
MVFYTRFPVRLAALIVFSSLGSIAASAQQPKNPDTDIPTFAKESPKAVESARPESGAALNPIAPEPSIVIAAGAPPEGEALIVPPAPRVVAYKPGMIVLPQNGLGATSGYTAQAASATSPLAVNSSYGYRRDPFTGRGRRHTGIDFHARYGDTVGASAFGTVIFAGVKHGYGNIVILDHGNGVTTYYAHLSAMYVAVGQELAEGQILGAIGSTGRSTGPHLHYEVRANGHPLNPSATISFNEGVTYVNGRPLNSDGTLEENDEEGEPAAAPQNSAPPQSPAAQPAARPRRVAQTQSGEKMTVFYAKDSITSY